MRLIPFPLAAAFLATAAQAQDPGAPTAAPPPAIELGGDRVTVGVGVANLPDYDGADENQWSPAAAVIGRVGGIDFFTRGTQLYVDLARDRPGVGTHFELGVIGAVRLDRTGGIRNDQVEALGEIDTAYEVGGFVGVNRTGVITSDYDTLTARVGFVQDVSGVHDSFVLTPQVNYTTPLSIRTLVSIGASADYVGRGYNRTYSGITAAQSLASGLRAFDASDEGFRRVSFSALAVHSLSGDLRRGFGIGGGVLYGRLLGRAADSPLVRDVGDRDQWSFAAGLTYTF